MRDMKIWIIIVIDLILKVLVKEMVWGLINNIAQ